MNNKEIPSELLDNIAKQNFKNIIDKVRSGKTLSRVELSMVEELKARGAEIDGVQAHPKITKSDAKMRELIRAEFGISERKCFDWLKRLSGIKTSTGWQVEEVLNEVEKRRKAAGSGNSPDLLDLKKEKLQEEVWTLRAKRKEVEGIYIEKEKIIKEFKRVLNNMNQSIGSWIDHQTAKNPSLQKEIQCLGDSFREQMRNSF